MSKWTTHVMNVYKENKKKNPNYKFKDAMKDAKKTYNNNAKSEENVSGESKPKKSRKNKSSKKSKKNKSSKKSRKSRK
jgi:hypothetical protein